MRRFFPSILAASALAFVLSNGGCASCKKSSAPAVVKDDLSLVPRESNLVAMASLKKLRLTPLWKRAIDSQEQTAEQKARYADFVAQTGLDPLKQIDSVFVALPPAAASGEFVALLRGGPFDEAKLVAFMKKEYKNDAELVVSDYGGRKRYTDSRSGTTFAVFLDPTTLAFGSDGWTKKIIDLQGKAGQPGAPESAQKNEALAALVKRTHIDDAVWAAGIVPPDARERLAQNPDLKAAGSMKDFCGSADFAGGFKLESAIALGNDADATELAGKLKEQVALSRSNPQVQLLGLSRYFDGLRVTSQASVLHIDIKLDQPGVDDLVDRLSGLLKSIGGALPGAAPPGGAPVPPMPSPPSPPPGN